MQKHIAVVIAIAVLAMVTPTLAQTPPRANVKELLVHAPSWVKTGNGTWDCMKRTEKGWEPTCDPMLRTEPVFNKATVGEYSRNIYRVSFTETPPQCPPPRTASYTVVFEDYEQEKKVFRPDLVPVLVAEGHKDVPQNRWEYELP